MDYPGTTTDGLLDGFRLRVEQDDDAENPTSWGDHVQEGDEIHSRWVRGDVYGVIMERYVRYVNTEDPADFHCQWTEVESVWGCYLDDEYTALTVAREHGFTGVDYTDII